ncbi:hypothetical protein HG537_0B03180 [Torulaspora globosa]|uniref:Uncharacterized protein n=1 Tax=Torulaspora globosa TaxID=48254 RepID=A0A7H9HP28_9SACH|nr:hypothetical protein HG537_0B03180 [Torulaspora sp. CBS 2947]
MHTKLSSKMTRSITNVYFSVSRKDLYDDESLSEKTELPEGSRYEPELLEVDIPISKPAESDLGQEIDEFDFPLFSFGTEEKSTKITEVESANTGAGLMKVSLREPIYETPKQERPKSYYFSNFTEEERSRYAKSALDYDTILREASLGPYRGWTRFRGRVLDVKQHNDRIEQLLQREERLKKRRPGQKQRLARRMAQQREKERIEKAKEIKKMIKKKFHKRGGKKNKKKPEPALPRFRTE